MRKLLRESLKDWDRITHVHRKEFDEDGSDSYGATHTIRLYDLAEKEL